MMMMMLSMIIMTMIMMMMILSIIITFRSNKTLYGHISLVPLPPDYQPTIVDLPTSTTDQQEG